jgi:hypothetical protein
VVRTLALRCWRVQEDDGVCDSALQRGRCCSSGDVAEALGHDDGLMCLAQCMELHGDDLTDPHVAVSCTSTGHCGRY